MRVEHLPLRLRDTFTGCPGWTTTTDLRLTSTVTWYIAANKLAANYLSNTCWWRCWGSPLTNEQLEGGDEGSVTIKARNHSVQITCPLGTQRICRHHNPSSVARCDANSEQHVSCHGPIFSVGQISLAFSWINQCWQEENSLCFFQSPRIVCLTP